MGKLQEKLISALWLSACPRYFVGYRLKTLTRHDYILLGLNAADLHFTSPKVL